MIYYLKGRVVSKDNDAILLDVHDIGYQLLVTHVEDFSINEEVQVYTYNVIREDEQYLIGFKTLEERNVVLSLNKVKGLGPKTSLTMLASSTPESIVKAIASNNIAYLKHLPGIGSKVAAQIILDLKGELTGEKGDPEIYEDAYDALKTMGYKNKQIDRVLATINEPELSAMEIVKIALSKLRGNNIWVKLKTTLIVTKIKR